MRNLYEEGVHTTKLGNLFPLQVDYERDGRV